MSTPRQTEPTDGVPMRSVPYRDRGILELGIRRDVSLDTRNDIVIFSEWRVADIEQAFPAGNGGDA